MCPDRHQINLQIDMLQNMPSKTIQTSGYVTVSCFYFSVLGTKTAASA